MLLPENRGKNQKQCSFEVFIQKAVRTQKAETIDNTKFREGGGGLSTGLTSGTASAKLMI